MPSDIAGNALMDIIKSMRERRMGGKKKPTKIEIEISSGMRPEEDEQGRESDMMTDGLAKTGQDDSGNLEDIDIAEMLRKHKYRS